MFAARRYWRPSMMSRESESESVESRGRSAGRSSYETYSSEFVDVVVVVGA